jgi:hypothetical protein
VGEAPNYVLWTFLQDFSGFAKNERLKGSLPHSYLRDVFVDSHWSNKEMSCVIHTFVLRWLIPERKKYWREEGFSLVHSVRGFSLSQQRWSRSERECLYYLASYLFHLFHVGSSLWDSHIQGSSSSLSYCFVDLPSQTRLEENFINFLEDSQSRWPNQDDSRD